VLAGNGIPVYLATDPTPTPLISFAVLDRQTAGAVVITASHNPPAYNGFKVRDHRGVALPTAGLQHIEARLPRALSRVQRMPLPAAVDQGLIRRFDPAPAYTEYLERCLDLEPIRQAGLKVVYDGMWGVGAGWLERLLGGGATRIHPIRSQRHPLFPGMRQPEPIPPNVDALLAAVTETGADVGIANDGDADRIGLADEQGRFVNQLQVAGLLALYLLELRQQRGAIVKTLSSTVMLEHLGQRFGVDVFETAIDPKYIGPTVIETDALLGATESGGFLFRGLPERDGILAALYILDLMVRTGKGLTQLLEQLYETVGARYSYGRIDTHFPAEQRAAIVRRLEEARPQSVGGLTVTGRDTTDGFKFHLADGGWLLIRFSGTEPMMRFYCETAEASRVQVLLDEGLKLAGLV